MTAWIIAYLGIGFLLAVLAVKLWGHGDAEDAFAGTAITVAWLPMAVVAVPVLLIGGIVRLTASLTGGPR